MPSLRPSWLTLTRTAAKITAPPPPPSSSLMSTLPSLVKKFTELVTNNPTLSFLLVNILPAGSLVALFSSVFYWVISEVKACFISKSYIYQHNSATIWRWMMLWLSENASSSEHYARRPHVIALDSSVDPSRRVRQNRGPGPSSSDLPSQHNKADFSLLPHRGTTYRFWYKGSIVWCTIAKEQRRNSHPAYGDDEDCLEICVLGLNGHNIAKQLVCEAKQIYSEKLKKQTIIWTSASHYGQAQWKQLDARPSRPMDTVILEGKTSETLAKDIKSFMESSEWYYSRGIPYRRGYLLYGPPGCGKTSCITALAGELHMVICIIDLSNSLITNDTLLTLFASAPKHSILLLEDVDVAFKKREDLDSDTINSEDTDALNSNKTHPLYKRLEEQKKRKKQAGGVTFSGLLNAIDGVAAQEGKIIIMTTNYIEELDPALIRPGRVDVRAFFQKGSKRCAQRLFKRFYRDSPECTDEEVSTLSSRFAELIPSKKLSMAQIQGHLMNYKNSPGLAVDHVDSLLEIAVGKTNQALIQSSESIEVGNEN
eukprot:UC4_evm1s1086